MTDDIPPLRPPHEMPPVHTEHDLEQHWRALMGPLGFGSTKLWIVVTEPDGTVVPHVIVIEDNPATPDRELIDNLTEVLRELVRVVVPGGRIAALWTRPGRGSMNEADRSWLRGLHRGLTHARLDAWPLHFANDAYLSIVAPDDLAA